MINRNDHNEIGSIIQLERTLKDHEVQLLDHFRTNQKLKHVVEGIAQTPLER